jgi:hypothetical protein
MFKKAKEKDLHPLSINIKKLQRFNFETMEITDIVVFEYLVLMYMLYGFKE